MGFSDLLSDAGLTILNTWLSSRSYIVGESASQADVAVFKAVQSAPDAEKYPNAARWYKHVQSYESEFATLPGDATAAFSTYGPEAAPAAEKAAEEEDDDVDLFGSDDEEEDAEAARIREERLAEYHAKKAAKGPKPAAKSIVTLDVKPWDDETDMKALEEGVRAVEMDGLVWGGGQLLPIGYGIKKLQINCVVEDDKVAMDDLSDQITELEDYVQSVDVAAMQKL